MVTNMVIFSVSSLDQQLVKILDIAYTWKAVLLLDEADIYLEKRNTTDMKRNAMVGVFLRRLEYYQGKKNLFVISFIMTFIGEEIFIFN